MKYVVIATGPSLTDEQIGMVGHLPCVAVSNAYQRVPNAVALCSADKRWWLHYNPTFAGPKYSVSKISEDIERVGLVSGSNSGLLGMEVAVKIGATSLILLGFDMHGSHYFGAHPHPLKNTDPHGFQRFKDQFAQFRKVPVVNCTPNSALECFPKMELSCALSLP